VVEMMLVKEGFEVHTAANGTQVTRRQEGRD
jgi:hypothetical protein